jgi:cystathionine beta-synthase
MSVGMIADLKKRGLAALILVSPHDSVREAIEKMDHNGLSQLPVIDSEGKSVGSVRENRLMAKALENRDILDSPIIEVMEPSFPVVDESVDLKSALSLLKNSPALVIEEFGRAAGIVTRHDILEFI